VPIVGEKTIAPKANDIRLALVYNMQEFAARRKIRPTMLGTIRKALRPSPKDSLARSFSRLGWLGFWMQIAVGAIPVILIIYSFLFGSARAAGTRSGFPLIQYLTIAGLVVLAFTTLWFYRYTRLAARIADPERRPSELSLQRTVWKGVMASTLGIVFSMLVMFFEVTQLLIYFLRAPQAGIPVIQTTTTGSASWVSAADIMSILALLLTMFVEITVLIFGLWLLLRTMTTSAEYPHIGDDEN
jgi:hypothetical protein